ncbi:NADH-quinone oxidoreductase subunit N [Kallotenue papyrolyticum]|uniref:NADH-quinone oxidoreductase subunit N n=1 Tax=Kallotenue papyrolyticum TaxID=1325125 RepID=UPI000478611D|nr:NADH-quinone oxidoreductase subunit N [Kallotenue papyrolyticum]
MNIEIPSMDVVTIAPPLALVIWASVLLLADLFIANKRVTAYLALMGLGVTAVVAALFWGAPPRVSFANMAIIDDTAIAIDWILLLSAAVTILLAVDYLRRQQIEMGEFYPVLLFTTAAMMTMAHSHNLIMLFLGLEWLSIGLYVLAGFAYPRIRSEEAAMKYLLYGAFAAGFLVYGIALLYGATGTVDLRGIADALRATPTLATSPLLLIGVGLLLIGIGYKVSIVPFHMWTPDVYEGAPTPVTAYMAAATKTAGFAALLRVLQLALPDLIQTWQVAVAGLAALTMIVGNLAAVAQSNIKRMLAYSSIAHAGFMLCAVVGLNLDGATQSFLYYLLAYALMNLGAFAVVIALEQTGEERFDISDLAGLGWRQPLLGVAMAIFMLSLAGIPPLAGFFAKWLVFYVAYQAGYWWLALIGLLTSIVSAFYYLRIVVNMYMRERSEPLRSFATSPLRLGVAAAAVLIVIQGFLIGPVFDFVGPTIAGR